MINKHRKIVLKTHEIQLSFVNEQRELLGNLTCNFLHAVRVKNKT